MGARFTLAAIVAIGLALPASTSAVTLHASSAPAVIRGAPPWKVTYTLELDAGPLDEEVTVFTSGRLEQVAGAASVLHNWEGAASIVAAPGCMPPLSWQGELSFNNIGLELPAETVSFVTVSRARATFPTPGDDLSYVFRVNTADVRLPGPAIMLPRRPGLSLTSRDIPRFGALVEKRLVGIRGQTDAALSGQVVDLRYTRTADGTGPAKLIAHVRVRRDGSFAYRWLVPGHGRYSVSARYRSQDSRFVSARSECLLGFVRP